ncbi:PCNA-associated factor-like [Achroia grisella]|uniref:PCNA-associated factor-like n=1 Tax=Achroia grisella TaxID=688607 RepID=UPI0027D2F130|nr:PCNA-associated factor-like [Achroia grisella]
MARTKASVGAKVASGKSSKARCSVAPPSNSSASAGSSDKSARSYSGGNPVCPRETPKWQKPITNFFITKDTDGKEMEPEDDITASSSKSKPKRNVIESDEEDIVTVEDSPQKHEDSERPKNKVLDETIELEPLSGENSHKIEEYYPKNDLKAKGKGKKTKDKENIDGNVRRNSKRDLEDIAFGEESEHVSKKIKIGS